MNTVNYTNIEIRNGNEYRMLINNRIYDKSMFFYPVFKKSAEIIRDICSYDKESSGEQFALYYPNNIIMYCAERGGGKSSAMISFADALKNLNCSDKKNEDDFIEFWGDIPEKFSFSVLDVIDPTTIFDKEIFMRIILSKIFSELRARWEQQNKDSGGQNCNNSDRSKILEKFRKCYGLVDMIYQRCGEFDGNDDLEELADLGDSTNLKKEFKDLVDCFLQQFNEKCKKRFLVIQIDDADLNAKMAYQIIEDIRKYCIIPNIIVLMAVNMEQMHQIIEQHFVYDFITILKISHNEDTPITLDDTKDMAVRYINKVMPSTHQIHLPKIADFLRNSSSTLKLAYMKRIDGNEKDLLSYPDGKTEDPIIDYQERLIRLIYKKTGVMLVKTNNFIHNFLPKNMRELSHFLSYFCSMPDLDSGIGFAELFSILSRNNQIADISAERAEEEFEKRTKSLDALEQYLVKYWSDINLSRKNHKITSELADTIETIKVASAIKMCEKIKENSEIGFYIDSFDSSEPDSDGIPPISSSSYAYLMEKLAQISRNAMNSDDFAETYRVVYALQLLFTIFLHKEALMCIKRKSFESLYKVVNGELWTCNVLPEKRWMGRFKVDYRMLITLNSSFKIVDSVPTNKIDINEFLDCCYFSNQNSNIRIDLSDPRVVEILTNLSSGRSDYDIIYDVGNSLFNSMINTGNYSDDTYMLAKLNKIYDFLMNWDVRDYVEKTLYKEIKYSNEPENLQNDILVAVYNQMDVLNPNYPQFDELYETSIDTSLNTIRIICFSNRNIAERIIEDTIDQMIKTKSKLSGINFSALDDVAELLNLISRILTQLKGYYVRVEPLINISPTVRQLSSKITLIENSFNTDELQLDVLIPLENYGGVKRYRYSKAAVNKVRNEFKQIVNYFVSALSEWNEFIDRPKLKEDIMAEIDNAFDKKDLEVSKPVEVLPEEKEKASKSQKPKKARTGNKTSTAKSNAPKETTLKAVGKSVAKTVKKTEPKASDKSTSKTKK